MTISTLNSHNNIGVDIDETLVGGNPRKVKLWNFIENNPNKNYWLITFRTGAFLDQSYSDIEMESSGRITRDVFEGLYGIPPELSIAYHRVEPFIRFRKSNPKKWERIHNHIPNFNDLVNRYDLSKEWKAKKCSELGCTILIDDNIPAVLPGCEKYNVALLDSYKM
jgi:hypothetical protein